MTPTTIKLPDSLRRRVKRAASAAKTSAHAFMVAAIERETRVAEARRQMHADALAAEREFERTGEYYELEEVDRFLSDKLAGKKPRRPKAKRWPRSSSGAAR